MVGPTSNLWLVTCRSLDWPGRRCGRCTAQNYAVHTGAHHYEVLFLNGSSRESTWTVLENLEYIRRIRQWYDYLYTVSIWCNITGLQNMNACFTFFSIALLFSNYLCFTFSKNPLNRLAKLTRPPESPNWPAKLTCAAHFFWFSSLFTLLYDCSGTTRNSIFLLKVAGTQQCAFASRHIMYKYLVALNVVLDTNYLYC
jgi:hypothetical protein